MTSPLYQQIQQFYDTATGLWEEVWGEHLHHGYYGPLGKERKDRRRAQVDLIEELLVWSGVSGEAVAKPPQRILDVGCGIGGSALFLADRFGATVTGVTLSPVQAQRARDRAAAAGLVRKTDFQVADALQLPFPEGYFDWVWSLESGEHMPDKRRFLSESVRVLRPGGRLICATWCHRPTDWVPLNGVELGLLQSIYRLYGLPYVISLPEYGAIAQEVGLENIRMVDWSEGVAPFWDEVMASALQPGVWLGMVQAGLPTLLGALAIPLMREGYGRGLIRFGVFCGTKPSDG